MLPNIPVSILEQNCWYVEFLVGSFKTLKHADAIGSEPLWYSIEIGYFSPKGGIFSKPVQNCITSFTVAEI